SSAKSGEESSSGSSARLSRPAAMSRWYSCAAGPGRSPASSSDIPPSFPVAGMVAEIGAPPPYVDGAPTPTAHDTAGPTISINHDATPQGVGFPADREGNAVLPLASTHDGRSGTGHEAA